MMLYGGGKVSSERLQSARLWVEDNVGTARKCLAGVHKFANEVFIGVE